MKDLFSGQFTTSAAPTLPRLNPFVGFLHDARTAIDRLVALQHSEGTQGKGGDGWTSTG